MRKWIFRLANSFRFFCCCNFRLFNCCSLALKAWCCCFLLVCDFVAVAVLPAAPTTTRWSAATTTTTTTTDATTATTSRRHDNDWKLDPQLELEKLYSPRYGPPTSGIRFDCRQQFRNFSLAIPVSLGFSHEKGLSLSLSHTHCLSFAWWIDQGVVNQASGSTCFSQCYEWLFIFHVQF